MKDNIAVINADICLGCRNCHGVCTTDAVTRLERDEPLVIKADIEGVSKEDIEALCKKAHLHPRQWHCMCTQTRVGEVAAVVLKGATTVEELTLKTGIRSGCTAYCQMMSMRLLEAAGHELTPPPKWGWYPTTANMWDNVSQDVIEQYPGYFLEEDKDVFRKVES
ncbi:MAG: (2Fe-2S)-binding protein [Propionibacteriaceae bacterium]|nr:(2Fe-2S)-binding protein [Propionibacteriaceae bacterium]